MTAQFWILVAFVFAFGACIGSFLNVVIYRMPRDLSLVSPGSACPKCGKFIRFYDNIPLFSWLILRARCRYCKAPISPRYFVIELLTALMFVGVFWLYFVTGIRPMSSNSELTGMQIFIDGGWFIYLLHITLLAGLLAVSAIDLELWVVPLSACWFLTVVGVVGSALAPFIIPISEISYNQILPLSSAVSGAVSLGATIGLAISLILLKKGVFKQSYPEPETPHAKDAPEPEYDHRREMVKEVFFVAPIVAGGVLGYWLLIKVPALKSLWESIIQHPAAAGALGAMTGYLVGGAVVWATRIFGTFGFGREAMGMGDVHLLGAAGAFLGPIPIIVAFFVAPFFGLAWAIIQAFFKKTRQIPYVPFLSLGILTVMIFHEWIFRHLRSLMVH